MKGIIFDLLEQVVSDTHGPEKWDSLLESTGLDGAYTAVGSYPDEQLVAIVTAASQALKIEPDTLIRWFGRECIPILSTKYPAFFQAHTTTKSFLMTLNEVIHPEVRKLFPGAYAPSFSYTFPSEDSMALEYQSHRNLCSFAEGLIEGSAAHYGETVTIEQPTCAKHGGTVCTIVTTFARITTPV